MSSQERNGTRGRTAGENGAGRVRSTAADGGAGSERVTAPVASSEHEQAAATDSDARGAGGRRLPVAVIGAGPVGLAAAAHLLDRGEEPLVLEAGGEVAASVREWSHVRLFSPWKYLTDPVARGMLEATGWKAPDGDRLPTGGELVERYLEPLSLLPGIADRIRLEHRVVGVARRGLDRMKTPGREDAPFELVVETPEGENRLLARAVIDASGTWSTPNPLGSNGLSVPGERMLDDRIRYGIPDVLGRERSRYAGRRTLVVGSGHSAFNALLDLVELARREERGEVVWAIRGTDLRQLYGGGEDDELEARGELGRRLERVVERGEVRLLTGFRTARLAERTATADDVDGPTGTSAAGGPNGRDGAGGVIAHAENGAAIGPVDEIVATTGFRPDHSLAGELRLELDPATESPVDLAPLIDPNVHSCGTVYPHGYDELSHPESDFYIVGMKSYGRAPTFLLLTGYEQVRSVVAALAGDMEAAANVELVLPETGVCSTDLADDACCSTDEAEPATEAASRPAADAGAAAPGATAEAGESAACCGPECCDPAPAQPKPATLVSESSSAPGDASSGDTCCG